MCVNFKHRNNVEVRFNIIVGICDVANVIYIFNFE